MRIISFSDLHLEFGSDIKPPKDDGVDVMVLAGDIITLSNYDPLSRFLETWRKPVIYVAGNHEYYTRIRMDEENRLFKEWLPENLLNDLYKSQDVPSSYQPSPFLRTRTEHE